MIWRMHSRTTLPVCWPMAVRRLPRVMTHLWWSCLPLGGTASGAPMTQHGGGSPTAVPMLQPVAGPASRVSLGLTNLQHHGKCQQRCHDLCRGLSLHLAVLLKHTGPMSRRRLVVHYPDELCRLHDALRVKAFDQCQQLFECAALRVHHEACRGCFPSLHFLAVNVEHAAGSSAGPLAAPLPPTKLSGELG
jgi:hypothetical protein